MMRRQHTAILDTRNGRGRKCKVRKRGTTPSSSSSLAKNYRLKRCVLIGRKTPKTAMESRKECLVSARKLGADLWETSCLSSKREEEAEAEEAFVNDKVLESSSNSGAMVLRSSDLLHSIKRMDLGKSRRIERGGSLKLIPTEYDQSSCRDVVVSNYSRLKDVYNSLITSRELLKVMNKLCNFHQQDATAPSLFAALKYELNRTFTIVTSLLHDRSASRPEIELLLEKERRMWKMKEQDRIRSAIASVVSELEKEKRLKRQAERLNAQLGHELVEAKASLSRATKELENEKRALEVLEQVCHDLARGITEDRAQVEKLKKQWEKERDEVEKEREMLQLADVLREERVQMKLCEARYQFEEKNAAVDKLRNELQSYLKSKKTEEQGVIHSPRYKKIVELEKYLKESPKQTQNEDEEDEESDLHSIELNAEDLTRGVQWITAQESAPNGKREEEEMEMYRMIKDLRDRIVSGAHPAAPQDHLPGSSKRLSFSASGKFLE